MYPSTIVDQPPSDPMMPCMGVESGCHDVPDASRIIEYVPSAPPIIFMPPLISMSDMSFMLSVCGLAAGVEAGDELCGIGMSICAWADAESVTPSETLAPN